MFNNFIDENSSVKGCNEKIRTVETENADFSLSSSEKNLDKTEIIQNLNPESRNLQVKSKPIRFLREFFKTDEEKVDSKSRRLKNKRSELAIKIFDHIVSKNKKYFENDDNFFNPDDYLIFKQFENIDQNLEKNDKPVELKHVSDFDHLELFRPFIDIVNEYKIEPQRIKFEVDNPLCKVSSNEFEKWSKNMMWSSSDLKGDYRNDIHTIKAGWIPAGNQRTWSQFLSNGIHGQEISSSRAIVYRSMANSLCSLANADPDLLNVETKNWFSLFPVSHNNIKTEEWLNKIILNCNDVFRNCNETMTIDPASSIDYYIDEEIQRNERANVGSSLLRENDNADKSGIPDISIRQLLYISSDDYYLPPKRSALVENEIYNTHIKHSLPALDLQRTLFPTYMDIMHLRRWHRPLLTDFDHGSKLKTGVHVIRSLKKYNEESLKVYDEIIQASGSNDVFLMKSIRDLTAMSGHLVLLEYSEEYPIFLSQIGMNSILRAYFRKSKNDETPPSGLDYGELVVIPSTSSPFLGSIPPGEHLMAIENNMFRAPIYKHFPKKTDFLVIRNSQGYFIRKIPVIFTVGQGHPKIEVPSPNSKTSMRYARERLQIYIFRLFMKSKDVPKRLKIASIRRAFKQHSENSIRKRLKFCANYFRQSGVQGKSNWWILKSDFRLPTHEDMHERLQPEMVCAYYSMLAAQRRLKDAGYGKKSLFMAEDENDDEPESSKAAIEEEILCAPWHTARAFIMCQKGKCLLAINGFTDPTGCGEGFSYVRQNYKNVREDNTKSLIAEYGHKKHKSITGTDADLRRLKLSHCRQILHEMGISFDKIDKMQRWDMINLIRKIGSSSTKAGNLKDTIGKFARSARFSNIESIDKYKEECQTIFDLQNRYLSSSQEFSSDEELEEDTSDIDELTKDLESMLNNKRETNQYSIDEEEHGRLDLLRLLEENKPLIDDDYNSINDPTSINPTSDNKILKLLIHRTFLEADDSKFVRTEVVTDPRIISAYLRITKNPNYRQVYAKHDIKTMEELRKEKKRVQDQLRRIKRNEEQLDEMVQKNKEPKKEKHRAKPNVKCTACGVFGHMRTNRVCSKFHETKLTLHNHSSDKSSGSSSPYEKPIDLPPPMPQNIVKVEGTRLVVGKALVEAADELTRKSLMLKIPKDLVGKKRKRSDDYYSGYLSKQQKNTLRRRADPIICLNAIFEDTLSKLKEIPNTWPFHQPVCPKKVPDYLKIIKIPMDLQTMRDNTKTSIYDHRDKFIFDINLIHSNCVVYNGLDNILTQTANSLRDQALKWIEERDEELLLFEIEINPLLSHNSQLKLSWILENIITGARSLSAAQPFLYPVNVKLVRDYYSYVQKPMDLDTIRTKCSNNEYSNRSLFMKDVDLILNNCITYNGSNHIYTKMAEELHGHITKLIQKNSDNLAQFEKELSSKSGYHIPSQSPPKISPKSISSVPSLSVEQIEGIRDGSDDADLLDDLQLSQENSCDETF